MFSPTRKKKNSVVVEPLSRKLPLAPSPEPLGGSVSLDAPMQKGGLAPMPKKPKMSTIPSHNDEVETLLSSTPTRRGGDMLPSLK